MANGDNSRSRAVVIDEGFAAATRWCIRVIVIAAAVAILGWIIGKTWMVFFPVVMALIVSTVLGPPVTWLRHKGWPSGIAAALVVLGFIAIIVGGIAILTPRVAGQADEIAKGASDGLQRVRDWLTEGPLGLSNREITSAISAIQNKLQASAAAIGSGVFSTIGAATSVVVNLVLVLMLTFFFVRDGHKFLPWAKGLAGQRVGEHIVEFLGRAWETLGGFVRTQSLVALIDAVIIGIGLVVVGVPLAIALAVVTFFGGFIPIIGAFVSGALAVLVTLVTNSPTDALIVLLIVVAVQQLEGNVLSPWLQGKSMKLHAAVVLLSLTAGGTLFGVTGAFLAVPVAATVAVLFRYLDEQINAATSKDALPAAPPASDS